MPYDVARDFAAVAPLGSDADRAGHRAVEGHQDLKEFVDDGQGQARRLHLRLGRRRLDDASDRRALPSERRLQAVHVPFRGGGFRPEVTSGRVDFAFSPIAVAVPDITRRPAAGARVSAPQDAPRRCPTCRPRWRPAIRIPTTRSGSACSCRRRRRAPSSSGCTRKRQGAAEPRPARAARGPRRRADADDAGRVRRASSRTNRRPRRAGQGGRAETELSESNEQERDRENDMKRLTLMLLSALALCRRRSRRWRRTSIRRSR